MSNDPQQPSGADDLQFDRVESAVPAGVGEPIPATSTASAAAPPGVTVCVACGEPISDTYFEANGKVVCPRCRDAVVARQTSGSAVGRFAKATLFGIGAGIVGAAIWYGVRVATGYEVGLIAVVVGVLVGSAVKAGSGRRGGVGYQLLAVLLTYLSIAANYSPDVIAAMRENHDLGSNMVAVVIITVVTSLVAPFLGGLKNIIGLLIVGFALYEAWIINRPKPLVFNGPYRLATAGAAPPPPLPPVGGR